MLIHIRSLFETLTRIERKIDTMSAQSDAMLAAVQAEDTEIASAVKLIDSIPTIVADAVAKALAGAGVPDPAIAAAIDTATKDAQAQTAALQAALVANTPSAPPAPAPAPTP
jgi:hypothetical protein